MSSLNADRAVLRIVREVAAEHGVKVETYGEGWILRLSKADKARFLASVGSHPRATREADRLVHERLRSRREPPATAAPSGADLPR